MSTSEGAQVGAQNSGQSQTAGEANCIWSLSNDSAGKLASVDNANFILGCGLSTEGKIQLTGKPKDAVTGGGSIGGFIAYRLFYSHNTGDSVPNVIPRIGVFANFTPISSSNTSASGSAGVGLHLEFPNVKLPAANTPLGFGLLAGYSYSGQSSTSGTKDQYNGKPWIGLSIGTYF